MIFRSCVKVKVIGQIQAHHVKNVIFIYFAYFIWASRANVTRVNVKGHIGQVQMRVPKKGRWAHINVKLLHFHMHKFLQHFVLPRDSFPNWYCT